jgi:membrane-bound lytic murein transglycosylase B
VPVLASLHRARLAAGCLITAVIVAQPLAASADDVPQPPFETWLADLRSEALARGIAEDLLERALEGVAPLPVVVERDQSQAEFVLTLDRYLQRRLTAPTVRMARRQLARHRTTLRRVQAAFGVDPATLVSIWGLESNFGRFSGVRPTVVTLATLAYEPRRAAFFREELFHALEILQRGDIDLDRMKGSWAGAMGQPQFMPSSYARYAVDFDRDGRRDIWTSSADVFGSIGNYLKAHGWTRGERWGREVKVSPAAARVIDEQVPLRAEGCRAVRELSEPRPVSQWHRLGVRRASGARLPVSELSASLLRLDGRAFLVYGNYEAILGYNCAHPYALSIALLADRLGGR